VFKDLKAQLEHQVLLDLLETSERLVFRVPLEQRELLDHPEIKALLDLMGNRDLLVHPELREIPVLKDPKDQQEI